jgi:hypothetical protein
LIGPGEVPSHRVQATVRFDSVGKKNLLLSGTPARRA